MKNFKIKVCLLLILNAFLINGYSKAQTIYTKLIDSAYSFYQQKDYTKAGSYYMKAFVNNRNLGTQTDRYNAACSWSLSNQPDFAFNELNYILLDKGIVQGTRNMIQFHDLLNNDEDLKNLYPDNRWKNLNDKVLAIHHAFLNNLKAKQDEFETGALNKIDFSKAKDGKQAYQLIKFFNSFTPKKQTNYSIKFKVTDSLNTSYFVSLPPNYNPKKSYPIMFFLHGAVQGNSFSEFQDESVLGGWNRYYTKYAQQNEVIMVYPQGSKKYNWMGPDDGFFMVPAMLKKIKQSINIDDDKVFITGHSNGATGSFSYLMKKQSPFAGFYGFNTQPKVRTGGTFIKNILNRSYFNISTNEDYYFPPDANDSLNVIMTSLKADYQDHRYIGWPHWFPQFDESEPVYPMIFKDIAGRKRNAFQSNIYWECDNVKYGKADWIQINQLDTSSKRLDWHKNINFDIYKLLSYDKNENLVSKDTLVKAFNFPRKSGVVKGSYRNNQFHIETSDVKFFSIFISPEMVDVTKPIAVFVNGVKKIERKAIYNKDFIISNFKETLDRKAVWIDKLEIKL